MTGRQANCGQFLPKHGQDLPEYNGGLTEDVLRELHGHHRTVKGWGPSGLPAAEVLAYSRAARAIVLTYPELLAAARLGLQSWEASRLSVPTFRREASAARLDLDRARAALLVAFHGWLSTRPDWRAVGDELVGIWAVLDMLAQRHNGASGARPGSSPC